MAGSSQDILNQLAMQYASGADAASMYSNKPVESSYQVNTDNYYGDRTTDEEIATGKARFGHADFDDAVANGASGLEIVNFMNANRDKWGNDQQELYDQALEMANGAAINNPGANLDKILAQQQAQFQQSQALMQQQLQMAQAQYEEQLRISKNMANAYVPPAEQSAATATMGDQRAESSDRRNTNQLSELSSLSIVSGLGTQSNPLSGLALA